MSDKPFLSFCRSLESTDFSKARRRRFGDDVDVVRDADDNGVGNCILVLTGFN